jgi:hypothetical protein
MLAFRGCCIAASSTVAGSVHIRIGTRTPGTSTTGIALDSLLIVASREP